MICTKFSPEIVDPKGPLEGKGAIRYKIYPFYARKKNAHICVRCLSGNSWIRHWITFSFSKASVSKHPHGKGYTARISCGVCSGGSKWGARGMRPPSRGPKFLHFHAVLRKNWSNSMLVHPRGWRSPLWEILDPPLCLLLTIRLVVWALSYRRWSWRPA